MGEPIVPVTAKRGSGIAVRLKSQIAAIPQMVQCPFNGGMRMPDTYFLVKYRSDPAENPHVDKGLQEWLTWSQLVAIQGETQTAKDTYVRNKKQMKSLEEQFSDLRVHEIHPDTSNKLTEKDRQTHPHLFGECIDSDDEDDEDFVSDDDAGGYVYRPV